MDCGHEFVRDFGVVGFLPELGRALDFLTLGFWLGLLTYSTSLRVVASLRDSVLRGGLGTVGSVAILPRIWKETIPKSFAKVAVRLI